MYNKGVEGVLWFTISLGIIPYTKIFKMGGGGMIGNISVQGNIIASTMAIHRLNICLINMEYFQIKTKQG